MVVEKLTRVGSVMVRKAARRDVVVLKRLGMTLSRFLLVPRVVTCIQLLPCSRWLRRKSS